MSVSSEAVRGALGVLGRNLDASNVKKPLLATARTRAALDRLCASSPEEIFEDIDIRAFTNDLFGWSGTSKTTRPMMKVLGAVLQEPGRYGHAVEVIAYAVALAPLMEPDRLVRVIESSKNVSTVFSPARYTLQFAHKLDRLFSQFPEQRREQLAISLWEQSHTGRWWDLTAGERDAIAVNLAPEERSDPDLIEAYIEGELAWTPAVAERFRALPYDERIVQALNEYNDRLRDGKLVDPDFALLSSYLTWVNLVDRPESPVGGLLESLNDIVELLEDFSFPEKPKSFSDLFPNVRLYADGMMFPLSEACYQWDGRQVDDVRFELVKNAAALADNRDYMGNCTWSYKNEMEAGRYALYRLHVGDTIYNAAMSAGGNQGWNLREINSRHNRGNVPQNVRNAFDRAIQYVRQHAETAEKRQVRENDAAAMKKLANKRYAYRV